MDQRGRGGGEGYMLPTIILSKQNSYLNTKLLVNPGFWANFMRKGLDKNRYNMYCTRQTERLRFVQSLTLHTHTHTGCPRRNGQNFGRVFLMLNYIDITQNTYIQSWTVTEIMASEVWNFDSCYTLTDYQIHIKTGRNMWFL